ncbi:MAG: hypothetical protein M0038_13025 [Pseudomonadota bacterium]|nr:hypothetical protein [Pseudomonadota bacterium]
MSARGAAPGGGTPGHGKIDGNATRVPHPHADANREAARAAWRHGAALAVVLERGVSTPADVEGLGRAWADSVRTWLANLADSLPFVILTVPRDRPNAPSALLARDRAALRTAVRLLGDRTPGTIFWVSCASDAAWQIVIDELAKGMATEGRA